ncbi:MULTISPECIES: CE1759 family FMN reductase [Oerskovia]|uniref:NAD(P)H-dependent oxidoreductase n=1 Tax=Oerskovia gallyi TaxID=2762226 RepID=A0ABR8V3A7_9CELL|nr:CE1759 family FMN reductase [Oerskovia gallyi]MBD7999264.1 NAD(P)H-dependent oxidoreductase [Oerskovia gallyi]
MSVGPQAAGAAATPRSLSVVAVTGGVSFPSTTRALTDLLLDKTVARLTAAGVQVDARTIEVRDHAQDVATATVIGMRSEELELALKTAEQADLLIVATPVFRGSYSGIFKSFFDLVDSLSMVDKPVLLAATGGTARHTLVIDQALRPLFAFMGDLIVPTGVFASKEDWTIELFPMPWLDERAERAVGQLVRFADLPAPG